MPRTFIVAALATTIAIITAADTSAATVKKKVVKKPAAEQSESDAAMQGIMLDVATGFIAHGIGKGKMPKGSKIILKTGLKAMKNSAKKDIGKPAKKDPLKALFGGDDE